LQALAAASAAAGDVFLGLLQTILAIMVPNGAGIELGVQVDEDGDPVVVCTHGSGNVFWSRATVSGQSICTVTLMIAVFASVQNVPFVCVHPIGSYILGRGGNLTIGNFECRAGRIGRRHIELDDEIRRVLVLKLGAADAARVIVMLDSKTNLDLRTRLAKRKMQDEDDDETTDEADADDEVNIYTALHKPQRCLTSFQT
jgi:hypothetical protein